jgi:hypothetical protein
LGINAINNNNNNNKVKVEIEKERNPRSINKQEETPQEYVYGRRGL